MGERFSDERKGKKWSSDLGWNGSGSERDDKVVLLKYVQEGDFVGKRKGGSGRVVSWDGGQYWYVQVLNYLLMC